ncbi:MAG: MATE family efflux transporter [Actinobacteria bacterium]|nr:MATE family efflux transporter [Actinomycetota bacterium]
MEEEKKKILSDNLRSLLFKFSLPSITGMVITALYNFVDTIFVGKGVGPDAIAGLTIVLPVMIFIIAIGLITGIGAASIVSRSLGGGEKEKALIAAGNSLVLNVGLSIPIIAVFYVFMDRILGFLGASQEIIPYSRDYLSVMLFGFAFFSLSIAGNNLIRAEGKPRASMYAMLIGAVLNIILDPIFIFIFRMGVRGAAIATVISQVTSMIYILAFFLSKSSIYHLRWYAFRPRRAVVREILAIGFPSFLMEIIGSILFLVFIKVVRNYGGDLYIAVTGIGIRIVDLIFMPILGISQGFAPIAGFNFGAGLYGRVKSILKEALIWTSVVASAGFIIMVLFPQLLISIFSSDPELIRIGKTPLRLIAMFAPIWSVPILSGTFFQAIGKAAPAMLITISRDLLIFIPAVIIFPMFFGLIGVWISWPFTDFCSFIISGSFLLWEIKIINRKIELQTKEA